MWQFKNCAKHSMLNKKKNPIKEGLLNSGGVLQIITALPTFLVWFIVALALGVLFRSGKQD